MIDSMTAKVSHVWLIFDERNTLDRFLKYDGLCTMIGSDASMRSIPAKVASSRK